MYTRFSADNILAETLKDLGMSVNLFWALQYKDEVGKTAIERCINGTRELDSRTEAPQLLQLCRELRELQAACPCRIDWRDVRNIKVVMEQRRSGQITVASTEFHASAQALGSN